MTRRPLFLLVGLIALLAIGFAGLWVLMQKPAVQALESGGALAEATLPPEKPAESAAVESAAEASTAERQVVEKAAPAKKAASKVALTPHEAELKQAHWIEGKVRFPDGSPADEKIEIEARGKKFSNDAWHSVEVARDGNFRVAFAPGTRTGWLRLEGRYAYLPEDHKVKIPAKPVAPLESVELAPLLGGWIRGRVSLPPNVDGREAGLAGTKVQAWRMSFNPGEGSEGRRSLAGEIGSDERFEIGGVPGKTGWTLMIDADAFTRTQKGEIRVEAGKMLEVEIPLKTGVRLAGQVVDEDGGPVGDANFFYQAPNDPGDSWTNFHGKKSAADGLFDLRGAPSAKGTLSCEKSGFITGREEFGALGEGAAQQGLRIVLRRGNAVAGVVQWPEGQPAAGAQVSLRFTPEGREEDNSFSFSMFGGNEQSTKSDSEGKFKFTGLSKGKATLRAEAKAPSSKSAAESKAVEAAADGPDADEKAESAPEEAAPTKKVATKSPKGRKWTAIVEDVDAGTQNLVLTVSAGYGVPGRVVDSAGAPLTEFLVRAEPVEKDRQDWRPVRGAVTGRFADPDGRFTLEGLHEGEWMIRAEAKNAPACAPQQIRVPGQGTPLVLALAAGCSISGQVVNPRGEPVRSVRVRADPERDESSRFVYNANKRFSTSSDPEGRFQIDGIPPGPLKLYATCDEWASADALALDLEPGQKMENVRLSLRTPGRIVGVVVDQAGRSDGGRPISLNGHSGEGWQQTTSDANGRFTFEKLAPGDYSLHTQAKSEEYAAAAGDQTRINRIWQEQQRSLNVKVAQGETTEVTLGGPPKDAIHLVGHVNCGGRPVANAYVQAWRRQQKAEEEPGNFHTTAAEDGSYDLVLGGAGDYTIHVNADGAGSSTSISFEVKVGSEARQTRDFELPGARISGRVVDTAGKPQADVWLSLSSDHRARGERGPGVNGNLSTDAEGRFSFEHVAPGTYEIVCGGDGGWRPGPRRGRSTRSGLVVEAGKSLEGIEIVAQPACRVEGTIRGPDGAPVAGAQVIAVDEQGKSLNGWDMEVTDATGRFDFANLPPGRASFLAQKGSLTTGFSPWVTIQESEATKVDLALQNGTVVFIQTSDGEGAHVPADIQVFDGRGLDVSETGRLSAAPVEQQPGWRFGPLAPGKYTAVVMRKDKPDLRQELRVAGEATQAVNVRCD